MENSLQREVHGAAEQVLGWFMEGSSSMEEIPNLLIPHDILGGRVIVLILLS
jgi:hypothetical protein